MRRVRDIKDLAESIRKLTDRSDVPKGYVLCECGFASFKGKKKKKEKIVCGYCFHIDKKGKRRTKPCKCEILRKRQ